MCPGDFFSGVKVCVCMYTYDTYACYGSMNMWSVCTDFIIAPERNPCETESHHHVHLTRLDGGLVKRFSSNRRWAGGKVMGPICSTQHTTRCEPPHPAHRSSCSGSRARGAVAARRLYYYMFSSTHASTCVPFARLDCMWRVCVCLICMK